MSDVRGLRGPTHHTATPPLFLADERSVLIAALGNGPQARSALERVATSADLDRAPISVIRLAPLLVERAKAARLDTPNVSRLWGVVRHQWIASRLRLRLLAELAAEIDDSVALAAMKGAALVARDGAAARTRSMGDIDILVPRKAAMTVIKALVERGFHSSVIDIGAMTPADVRALHGAGLQRQRHEECDVHWYPLRRLRSDALTTAILQNREMVATPHGPLPVVAAADHLFLLLANASTARAEQRFEWPADVAALLAAPASIEWSRLRWLAARTQLRAELRATCDGLEQEIGMAIPEDARRALRGGRAAAQCARRSNLVAAAIEVRREADVPITYRGVQQQLWRCVALLAERAWRTSPDLEHLRTELRSTVVALRRARPLPRTDPDFVVGWSFPEAAGRWSDGEVALLRLPVGIERQPTMQAELEFLPFLQFRDSVLEIEADGGDEHATWTFRGADGENRSTRRALRCRIDPDGWLTIALRIVGCRSPQTDGPTDDRRLGMLLTGWSVTTGDTTSNADDVDSATP